MFGPTELTRTLHYGTPYHPRVDEVEDHRSFCCIFYDLCLKVAALKNWRSFTCKYCTHGVDYSDAFSEKLFIH